QDPRSQRKTPAGGLNAVGQTAIIFTCVFGGGDDQRGRTRVAGATGALAAGASRSGCRDLRIEAFAGLRCAASAATQEAQALPARPHFPHRGPAHAGHYRVTLTPAECRRRGSPWSSVRSPRA